MYANGFTFELASTVFPATASKLPDLLTEVLKCDIGIGGALK